MGRIFWQVAISLDGFMESPEGDFDWHPIDADFDAYAADMLGSIGGIILGRRTFEGFQEYWPTSADAEASAMNALPKYVFSRSSRPVSWANSTLFVGDAAPAIARLKTSTTGDLALLGSSDLAQGLAGTGLIDEYRILVAPVLLGGGRPAFGSRATREALRLVDSRTLSSGALVLSYEPVDGGE